MKNLIRNILKEQSSEKIIKKTVDFLVRNTNTIDDLQWVEYPVELKGRPTNFTYMSIFDPPHYVEEGLKSHISTVLGITFFHDEIIDEYFKTLKEKITINRDFFKPSHSRFKFWLDNLNIETKKMIIDYFVDLGYRMLPLSVYNEESGKRFYENVGGFYLNSHAPGSTSNSDKTDSDIFYTQTEYKNVRVSFILEVMNKK